MKTYKVFNESNFKPRSYHSDNITQSDSIFNDDILLNNILEKIEIIEKTSIDYIIYYLDSKSGSFVRINFFPDNKEKIQTSKHIQNSYFTGYISKEQVIESRKNIDWKRTTKDELIYALRAKKFNI